MIFASSSTGFATIRCRSRLTHQNTTQFTEGRYMLASKKAKKTKAKAKRTRTVKTDPNALETRISKWINRKMEQLHIKPPQLGKLVGMSRANVYRHVAVGNGVLPTVDQLDLYARAFGYPSWAHAGVEIEKVKANSFDTDSVRGNVNNIQVMCREILNRMDEVSQS